MPVSAHSARLRLPALFWAHRTLVLAPEPLTLNTPTVPTTFGVVRVHAHRSSNSPGRYGYTPSARLGLDSPARLVLRAARLAVGDARERARGLLVCVLLRPGVLGGCAKCGATPPKTPVRAGR